MRTYKKKIGEKIVRAYNDSNVEWVVSGCCDCGLKCSACSMRFNKRKFTMSDAMKFYYQICTNTVAA